jgi:hypothetical protein
MIRFLSIVFLWLLAASGASAQDTGDWKRVYTGDGYRIEVNVTSFEFAANGTLQGEIRTVLNKEELLKDGAKSKTRLEKVEYRLRQRAYRSVQVVLLDGAGKQLHRQDLDTAIWKPLKPGGVMDRVLLAARPGLPFGKWKVASYRFAEGGEQITEQTQELKELIGASVRLEGEIAQVDQTVCQIPLYKSDHFSVGELARKLGSDIKLPEVQSDQVDLIYVKCEGGGWRPPQSMLVKLPEGRMLMLWKGVFLTLKRT